MPSPEGNEPLFAAAAKGDDTAQANVMFGVLVAGMTRGMRESSGVMDDMAGQVDALEGMVATFRDDCVGTECGQHLSRAGFADVSP